LRVCKSEKCFGFWGSDPDPTGGACSAPPDLIAEISNILFEITKKFFGKSNSELVTPINIIFDCIKELFMLCTACFFRAKINKKIWPPYF